MYCNSCGAELADGAKFCGKCGAKMGEAEAAAQAAGGRMAQPVQPQVAPQPVSNPAPRQQPSQSGVLSTAWRDITSSPNWIKRMLLLMVMRCVPILSFFVDGYALKWGADAAKGSRGHLPVGNFDRRTFIMGVFFGILNILYAVAVSVLFIVGMIPFIGFIISFVVMLFTDAFLMLMAVRMALRDKLGAAFDLSEIWRRYKTKVGSLVGAVFLPSLIVACIVIVVSLIIFGIIMMVAASAINGASAMGSYRRMSYDPVGAIFGLVASMGIVIVFIVVLFSFLDAFAQIWSARAVGIWISRNAPDWANEE